MTTNADLFTDPWSTTGTSSNGAHSAPSGDSGSALSLRAVWRACRRRWRLCLAVAILGAVAGAGMHFLAPRKYSSQSSLYLYEPTFNNMSNDVGLLETRAVASRALHDLHLHMGTNALLASYSGVGQTNEILSLTVSGPTQAAALARNRALDAAFLSLRAKEFRLQNSAVVTLLRSQISALESQIHALDRSVAAAATKSSKQAENHLTDLINQRSSDQAQVVQLQGNVQQRLIAATAFTRGSKVLDPPAVVPGSAHKAIAKDALAGLVVGLALAFGAVAFTALLSDRPRRREDVAALLGAPIELSLGRQPRLPGAPGRRLDHLLERPSPSLLMIQRRLRAHLEAAPGRAIGVVSVGADDVAALAVVRLATSLAAEGRHVVLADTARNRPLAQLVAEPPEPGHLQPVTIGGQHVELFVGTEDPGDMAQQRVPDAADAVIVLADPDPAFGATHLAAWVSHAVVLVARERATSAGIATTAELLRHEDVAVRSGILLGTFPDDDTAGLVRRHLSPLGPRRFGTGVEAAPG